VSDTGSADIAKPTQFAGDVGFNVIGYLSSATGLGAAARSSIALIHSLAYPVSCADIDLNHLSGLTGVEQPPDACPYVSEIRDLPYRINFFAFNPSDAMAHVVRWRKKTGVQLFDRFNCVVPFWELPRVPEHWVAALAAMDAVLVPSKFVEDAIRAGFGDRPLPPLIRYPQSVTPPEGLVAHRRRWLGERAGTTAVLVTFDVLSDIERKNPWASIAAFQCAFGPDEKVTLLVKVNNSATVASSAGMVRLRDLAASDPRIVLMCDPLTRADLWNLYASCDIYMSLHRAEGLGLGPMEAMSLGKPVIATGWSGNMDFMDETNSIPVPYGMIPVGRTKGSYRDHAAQSWADPSIAAASAALRLLAFDPDRRAAIGKRAAETITAIADSPARAAAIDAIAKMAAAGNPASAEHRAHADVMRSAPYRAWGLVGRLRFAAGSVLRAIGVKPPIGPPVLGSHGGSDSR